MTEKVKKKTKKKSKTAIIAALKKRIFALSGYNDELWTDYRQIRDQFVKFKVHVPLKYYKIEFKIKNNVDNISSYSEVISSYSAELAIDEVKKNKTYPDTFELTNITLMA